MSTETGTSSPTRYAREKIVRPKGDKKSKLSKLKQKYGNNNLNNINPTTCCAQNNTLRAQENIPLSRWGAFLSHIRSNDY